MRQIAVIGGGPSGAMCAQRLASAGLDVTIYDEHLAWEKPCGGGLTHKAIVAYPFLLDGPEPKKLIHCIELIAGDGNRARVELDHPIVIYSRAVLNGLLLKRAAASGCRIVRARVTQLDATASGVHLKAGAISQEADFAVIAAGARNALLPGTQPLDRGDLEMTLGYFVPGTADVLKIKFLPRLEGYLWSFPRHDHLSVGICGRMARHTSQELRSALQKFLADECITTAGAAFYSHILPSPQEETLHRRQVVGEHWALTGDAAALVDPVTGEGLYYALRSGELLAETLIAGQSAEYPSRLRTDCSGNLALAAGVADRLYRGRFLGGSITTRTVQFAGRSPTFRTLMADIFKGSQDYGTLERRLWMQLGRSLGEMFVSVVHDALPARENAESLSGTSQK